MGVVLLVTNPRSGYLTPRIPPFSKHSLYIAVTFTCIKLLKLDGVGPVDNRPPTDKLPQFVKKKASKTK